MNNMIATGIIMVKPMW